MWKLLIVFTFWGVNSVSMQTHTEITESEHRCRALAKVFTQPEQDRFQARTYCYKIKLIEGSK